ncbi:hypothetical protein ACFLYR_08755 [Chloroflexota bacterium]
MMEKKVTRLYTGPDGESHFDSIEVAMKEEGVIGRHWSDFRKATALRFIGMATDYKRGWHNAPRCQYIIILEGGLEIEIGDGTKRQFNPGDVFLAEDTTGRGHLARPLYKQTCLFVTVALD